MFIPVGIFWGLCFKRLDNIFKVTLAGFGFSFLIEVSQLLFYERSSDIDDLILNTTGAFIGALIYFSAVALIKRSKKNTVKEKDDIYSVFDINGFRLGLFAYERKGESHEYGSNCLPSLSVDSKAILEKKIMGKEICFPLTLIRGNWVVEIVDSEGNHIEMTAPAV